MIYEKIDLYSYFNRENKHNSGILTVYCPSNSCEICINRKRPGILVLNGGGYSSNSFREAEPVSLEFLSRGYVVFELKYDIAPFSYDFAPLIEGAMAMKFIRENEEKYNLSKKVACCGFSAGGHLASFLATSFDDEIFKNYFGNTDGIRPDGVILSYAVISSDHLTKSKTILRICGNHPEYLEKMSTEKRVNENSSPAYIWTTYDDDCVDSINSLLYAEACSRHKVKFSIHIFPHGQHGLSLANNIVYGNNTKYEKSKNVENWVDEAFSFLREIGFDFCD